MSNTNDFEINKKGVLEAYNGEDVHVIIPEGVTSIGYGAFYRCENLASVSIGNGVTYIDDEAFKDLCLSWLF